MKYYFNESAEFWGNMSPFCMTEVQMIENCKTLSQEDGWPGYDEMMEQFHEATEAEIEEYGTEDCN